MSLTNLAPSYSGQRNSSKYSIDQNILDDNRWNLFSFASDAMKSRKVITWKPRKVGEKR